MSLAAPIVGVVLVLLWPSAAPTVQAVDAGPQSHLVSGASASLDPDGRFQIRTEQPAWAFGGSVGHPLAGITTSSGEDALGAFEEISFQAADQTVSPTRGAIRTYSAWPVALFSLTYTAPASRPEPFPVLSTRPELPFSQSYQSVPFSPSQFNTLSNAADGPWLFFDADARAYLLSPADNLLLARNTSASDGSLAVGLDPAIGPLPGGFTQRAMLVAGSGINAVYQTWGQALTRLHGKSRPANDADVTLARLGYWTDNGATYYYHAEPGLGYAGTLLAINAAFQRDQVPLGYVQLDSWWYPKGGGARWDDARGGIYRYTAAPELFPDDLAGFQRRLGLPLVTHARWIDPASPYRSTYAVSGNVVTDARYWDDRLAALASAGVVTYEQDWLGAQAQPEYTLTAPDEFLGNMARAAASHQLTLQYCMPLPRHYLQAALYGNLTSIRVSDDRFERGKWDAALYDAQLASAVGVWPWTDVFMSSERENLLLATLSGGVVGVGDALGAENVDNLRSAIRSDGVLVKPDAPLVPTDETYVGEAQGNQPAMVAATWTQHRAWRHLYVFAYARGASGPQPASVWPARLGLVGPAYLYEVDADRGTPLDAGAEFRTSVPASGSYFLVAPIGPSGVAFLGDAGRFVSLGRTRISQLEDDGVLRVTVEFADGEAPITLRGYADQSPHLEAEGGTVGSLSYTSSGLFTFTLAPDPGQTTVRLTAVAHQVDESAGGVAWAGLIGTLRMR